MLPTAEQPAGQNDLPGINPTLLLTRLSFSHFLELLALNRPLQRAFYEVQVYASPSGKLIISRD
jgi:hypothetical protein